MGIRTNQSLVSPITVRESRLRSHLHRILKELPNDLPDYEEKQLISGYSQLG